VIGGGGGSRKETESKMATGRTSSSLTSAKKEKFHHTKLDESKESLSLLSILQALDDPMTEDQAWAILYQSAKTGLECFTSANPREMQVMKCYVVKLPSHLWIHRDGTSRPRQASFHPSENNSKIKKVCVHPHPHAPAVSSLLSLSLSLICISCVCVECRTGRWGSKNKGEEKTEDQKTDEGWKKKIKEKEKISQLTCD
jgi:hypothetical protein